VTKNSINESLYDVAIVTSQREGKQHVYYALPIVLHKKILREGEDEEVKKTLRESEGDGAS
jgi:hypothetical protein